MSRYACGPCAQQGWEQTRARKLGLPPVKVESCEACRAARRAERNGQALPKARSEVLVAVLRGEQPPSVLTHRERQIGAKGLLRMGLPVHRVQMALGVSERSVWRWKRELTS